MLVNLTLLYILKEVDVHKNDPRFILLKPKRNHRLEPLDLPLPKFIVIFFHLNKNFQL